MWLFVRSGINYCNKLLYMYTLSCNCCNILHVALRCTVS